MSTAKPDEYKMLSASANIYNWIKNWDENPQTNLIGRSVKKVISTPMYVSIIALAIIETLAIFLTLSVWMLFASCGASDVKMLKEVAAQSGSVAVISIIKAITNPILAFTGPKA